MHIGQRMPTKCLVVVAPDVAVAFLCFSFTYQVALPDYSSVRALFDSGSRTAANELCNSGQVWLRYAKGLFQVMKAPFQPYLVDTMSHTQSVVNRLRDLGVAFWPPTFAELVRLGPDVEDVLQRH